MRMSFLMREQGGEAREGGGGLAGEGCCDQVERERER